MKKAIIDTTKGKMSVEFYEKDAPNTVKKIVVGVGHAAKEQVEHMVKLQMPGTIINGSDASDALGIAICHAHHVRFEGNLEKAIKKAVSLK